MRIKEKMEHSIAQPQQAFMVPLEGRIMDNSVGCYNNPVSCNCGVCIARRKSMDMNVTDDTHENIGTEIRNILKHKELSLLTMADLLSNLSKELRDKHEEAFES